MTKTYERTYEEGRLDLVRKVEAIFWSDVRISCPAPASSQPNVLVSRLTGILDTPVIMPGAGADVAECRYATATAVFDNEDITTKWDDVVFRILVYNRISRAYQKLHLFAASLDRVLIPQSEYSSYYPQQGAGKEGDA